MKRMKKYCSGCAQQFLSFYYKVVNHKFRCRIHIFINNFINNVHSYKTKGVLNLNENEKACENVSKQGDSLTLPR